ncbi:MAG TPA: polyhydroxyalkanoate depolymerase [Dongiaceae bacterium]
MLYQAIDAQLMSLAPARMAARYWQHVLTHPMMPASYTTAGRATAAICEMFDRSTKRHRKPRFNLTHTTVAGTEVQVADRVVLEKPFCNLLHFHRELTGVAQPGRSPKVLVVAPMSGHYATLLRGTVETLLPDNDVYITDWADARLVPLSQGDFDLATYVDYVIDFIRFLGSEVHIIAVCQPSPPVLSAVALMAAAGDPAQPRSVTLMGGPIDTRVNPTEVNDLSARYPLDWFERSAVHTVPLWHPGALRRVYPGFLQLGSFVSMNPDRHVGSHLSFFENLVKGDGESADSHRRFYDEYLSVMDLSAEFYLDTVRHVFQDHSLPNGTFRHRGQLVEPAAIERTGLMTIEGELDDISGPGQTEVAHGLCQNLAPEKKRHLLQKSVGHYGIFNGRRWRNEIYPQWCDFVQSQGG